MKFNYIKTLAFVCSGLILAGCSENSWNDRFLDGYEGEATYDETVSVSYTLTPNDYETIGKALASIAETEEETAAAKAIQANHYFDQQSPYPAQIAVPYLFNQVQTPYYVYNNGSTIEATIAQADVPAEITKISAAPRVIITETISESAIPGRLADEFPDAANGDYAIVSYDNGASPAAVQYHAPKHVTAHKGFVNTRAEAWTVAEALSQMAGGFEGEATVAGIISEIQEISTSYGNATYFIKDNLSDSESLEIYRGYWFNGDKFTSEDQLQVGASVVVSGKLVDYNGTFEFTTGSQIISYNGEGSGGDDNTGGDNTGGDNTGDDDNNGGNEIGPDIDWEELTNNIKDLKEGEMLSAVAVVTAQSSRGLILTDNGGSILYYNTGVNLSTYPLGTIVNVSGEVGSYNSGFQLSDSATLEVLDHRSFTYPDADYYDATMLDEACAATGLIQASYVAITGELLIDGTYFNVIVNGASAQGSIYYPTDAIKNQLVSGNSYTFFGYFIAVSGSGRFFNMVVTSVEEFIPEYDVNILSNAVYTFNGNEWMLADNAVAMDPWNYTALGLQNNKLEDPAIYLPIYMKSEYPYAAAGTETYVAYNLGSGYCSCALMEYDGANWTYVDSFIETKVAAFAKSEGTWSFRKYIGEEVFTYFDEEEIQLNCSYMIVYGNVCADPVPADKNYGYLQETQVVINEGSIVMPNDNNAFTFVTTTEYNGNTYTAPEGKFMILDSNGRYMYLQGTYSSFNVRANNAYIENDGTISPGYLWSATRQSDGTWMITNEREEGIRTIYYSDGNADFAAYTEENLDRYVGVLPSLYISEASRQ